MTTQLLGTKLHIPPLRPATQRVARPRLLAILNQGIQRKLTLVSAPAGFGKTTLLSEWIWELSAARPPAAVKVAWVSLDEGDSDPVRFWSYVVAALAKQQLGLGESTIASLRGPQKPPLEAALGLLINDLLEIPNDLVLVLDDYHTVKAQPVHESLAFFLDNLPPRLHLVVAGRSDPPLPLARLRGRGQLVELRADDLRFSEQETAAFLGEVMGLDLTADDVTALELRTEGWITGLQLAALSLQGRKKSTDFVSAFAGDDRYILDYLVEEVLAHQTGDVRDFLLQTSMLERLSGSLCDAVAGRTDSQAVLESLEQSNLFLVPLDNRRQWYRYHHLFADLLRHQLDRVFGESGARQLPSLAELHQRASHWYQQNEFIAEAVEHSLAAGDFEQAASLVESVAWPVIQQGEYQTLIRWLEALPQAVIYSRAELCLMYAWALTFVGEYEVYEQPLAAAEQIWRAEGNRAKLGQVLTLRADVASVRDETEMAISLAQQALELLDPGDLYHLSLNWLYLGISFHYLAQFDRAQQAYERGCAMAQASGNTYCAMACCNSLGVTLFSLGKLGEAEERFRQVLEMAGDVIQHGGLIARLFHGTVLYERNQLEAAESKIRYGLKILEQTGLIAYVGIGYTFLAKVLWARGKGDEIGSMLDQGAELEEKLGRHVVAGEVRAIQAQLALAQGDLATVERWRQTCQLTADDPIDDYRREAEYLTLARFLIADGREGAKGALSLLSRWLELAVSHQRVESQIRILILEALAHQALGELTPAVAAIQQALTLAEPGGYVRIFVDEGAPMHQLLLKCLQASDDVRPYSLGYLGNLMKTLSDSLEASPGADGEPQLLVEPLTPRELEVLTLIAAGFSNREIAQELVVTLNTVKVHIKNLYRKLDVANRTQAVACARDLNLL